MVKGTARSLSRFERRRRGCRPRGLLPAAAVLLATTLCAPPAMADDPPAPAPKPTQPDARRPPEPTKARPPVREEVSVRDAMAIVRQAHGGRVVSAQAVREPRRGYRVRIDVDGRVKSVFVDSRGRIDPS